MMGLAFSATGLQYHCFPINIIHIMSNYYYSATRVSTFDFPNQEYSSDYTALYPRRQFY
jgi:hypothetical protein